LDHFCHHLVCFHKTNAFSYLYVKNTCFGKSKYLSSLVLIKSQKSPPFSHNQISPPQECSFCNKRVLIKETKYSYTRILKNSQVVADPDALALISPPLALSTKIEELVAF
jgi:hypothetical protein